MTLDRSGGITRKGCIMLDLVYGGDESGIFDTRTNDLVVSDWELRKVMGYGTSDLCWRCPSQSYLRRIVETVQAEMAMIEADRLASVGVSFLK